ncbi:MULTISPECIES: YihY/virulence factor BrkB family protein [Protofrankia]|uniref:Ribonuclease BN n=1 Tax=Candidatus Protofrankia datiscae TaxID=2716812 RepID=F8B608_9ACTN|nr:MULTISPECIES: YihY/virulence factor BrkB family protein [Protofrankia]AEH11158.1 ribonuclease BN [Candidatus Protofrankia datiscae]
MANPISAFRSGARKASDAAGSVRRRRPFVDHAVRGYRRYAEDGGDRLAAAATYFAFLSFFPLVALAFSITGFVVDAYPNVQQGLANQINSYLPGMADKLDIASIGNSKVGVGLIGLAALLLAGLAWINALRDAIRIIWHQSVDVGNALVRRLRDLGVLVGLGLIVFASIAVTSVITSVSGTFLEGIGLSGSTAATVLTTLLALGIALALDVTVFLCLFLWLPSITDRRRAVRGALLGAVGVESLKLLGTWLVGMTTDNPVYGTFAVIVGLLIWINIVLRWTLLVAAWTVTAPYDSDVVPSGTAATAPDDGAAEPVDAVLDGGAGAAGRAAEPPGEPAPAGSSAAGSSAGAVAGSVGDRVDAPAPWPGPSAPSPRG